MLHLIRRPFKGQWFYEWQIGPLVLQWRHSDVCYYGNMATPTVKPWYRRPNVWFDSAWYYHTKLARFLRRRNQVFPSERAFLGQK
jgi:hypothetical protein